LGYYSLRSPHLCSHQRLLSQVLAMALLSAAFFAAILLLICHVQAHPASPLAVAVVKEQFKNAKIVPDILPAFEPTGLTSLNYTGVVNKTTVGVVLSKADTASGPLAVYIRGTESAEETAGGPFNLSTIQYTVIMFDAGAPGYNSSSGYPLQWLANNWTYGENNDHTVTLNPPSSSVVAYNAPAPVAGTGPHRYITLVYPQPVNFAVPDVPPAASSGALFNLTQYKLDSGLTSAIAGTYFTVEEGTATVSIVATSPVDSKTLPQYTPTSTAAATGSEVIGARADSMLTTGLVAFVLGLFMV